MLQISQSVLRDLCGAEKQLNVILIMVESLSAEYMGTFGNKKNLTPNLDKLAHEGLLFSNFYATATPTTRALIGNYQQLGLLTPDNLIYIQPVKEAYSEKFILRSARRESDESVRQVTPDSEQLNRLIAYYEAADYLYQHQLFNQTNEHAQLESLSKSLAKQ
jgi:hypothetical protein